MRAGIEYAPNGDGYTTPVYTVFRWSELMVDRPGTYRVIASRQALDLAWMGDAGSYRHPTCVVDDFGSLVAVPA